jgi:hypothetical protein
MSIVTCTLDLTGKFIDLQKYYRNGELKKLIVSYILKRR